MTSGLKLVKKPRLSPGAQHEFVRQNVARRLRPTFQRYGVEPRKEVVAGWQPHHRPDFAGRIDVQRRQIIFEVIIRNASTSLGKYGGTVADLWRWFTQGTRPHIIVPRFASVLRFVVGGVTVFTKRVRHPGTRGSRDDRRINRSLTRRLVGSNRAIDTAYKRALKAFEGRNRR